ncbi:SDR family oxidoreductase [Tabrizicola sp.]|uniref:SDR family NAD(P)-dependent oxidoreductase n=1 Tax=Tabrizicola sp. TaxID=2005166 RepID=UPI0027345A83|nr:SDR family NAD(P)-dependent oxidoreductase [Tabrizicola sp.]MDP3193687.1 SDR family NAD(P)-dependent oxidoreductase [Tabrizicola sp.]
MTHPAIAEGHTAVITGAASGIGLAAARALAAQGMIIALIDLPSPALEIAAAALPGSRALPVDVANQEAVASAAATIAAEMPPVTLLFNNAGLGLPSTALGDRAAWDRTLAVNFGGILTVAQAIVPAMLAHGLPGAVINTGSKQGITLPPGNPAYNVSKAAVKAYTELLAHELRTLPGSQVSAHLMIPGWVHTGMTAASGAPKPAGAWTPEQAVDFMLDSLVRGDFYILCPDNDVSRTLDERRIAWAAGDVIENRPALSRWHPDWADAFKRSIDTV